MTDETSGIVGNTRNAQLTGTETRKEMKEKMVNIPRITALVVIFIIFVLLLTTQMSIFWKLVSGGILLYLGGKLDKVKMTSISKDTIWKFPIILKALGGIMIATSLLTSGVTTKLDGIFTYVDTCLKSECPESDEGSQTESSRSPDRVNRTVGGYHTSTLGYLPVITIRPGGKSVEISSYSNSCLRIEHISGSTIYQARSRGADGVDRPGMIPGAQKTWITLPASAQESAIIQVRRRAC